MRSVNKVILLGNLTRDPELKQTEGKKPVCIFGLATNRNWTDQTGEKHEETMFHRIIAWDHWAETCQQYLKKGRKVYVEGGLQSHSYTGQDGIERTGVEVVLEDLVFVDRMPKDVQDTLEAKDTVDGAPVQQFKSPATKRVILRGRKEKFWIQLSQAVEEGLSIFQTAEQGYKNTCLS